MFLCGVEVEVSFSALYSNVLVAFASVKSTVPQTQDCTVTLSTIPVNICFYLKLSSCQVSYSYSNRSIFGYSCTSTLKYDTDRQQTNYKLRGINTSFIWYLFHSVGFDNSLKLLLLRALKPNTWFEN